MDFEWDEDKNRSNIAKHGIGFERAARIISARPAKRSERRIYHDEIQKGADG